MKKSGIKFSDFLISIESVICKHIVLYYLLQFTWGILGTILGYIILLILLPFGKVYTFNHTLVLKLNKNTSWGFSVGTVAVAGNNANISLIYHEYGHTLQNAILGPLAFVLVIFPSFIRYQYREIHYYKKGLKPAKKYDDIWFEFNATHAGFVTFLHLAMLNINLKKKYDKNNKAGILKDVEFINEKSLAYNYIDCVEDSMFG